jgi:hypothetical protein
MLLRRLTCHDDANVTQRISSRQSLRTSSPASRRLSSGKADPERDHVDLAWGFNMNGTNPDLLPQDKVALLASAQSQPFGSSGDDDPQAILQMLPMLDNCPNTREQTLDRTGILSDLVPSHLP